MRLRSALLAATVLAAPVAVQAQPFNGVYIGAGAGYNYLEDIDARPSPALGHSQPQATANSGFTGLGSVGYGFGNGIRIELEGNYRQTQVRRITGTGFPTTSGGQVQNYGAMVNALFDMDIGFPWIYPYLGLGAGYGWTNLNKVYAAGTNFPFTLRANDTAGNFAWQVIAGLSFPIPNVPGLSLTAEYRFYSIIGPELYKAASVSGSPTLRGSGVGNFDLRNQYHQSVLLGVRYAFNVAPPAAPPAPVAAPAPAPARSYLVFFDWDKRDANRSRPPNRPRGGRELDPRAVHADRGERLYRHVGQRRATTSACRSGAPRRSPPNSSATACQKKRSRSRASARRICWCRPAPACVSRRTGGWRSSSADRAGLDGRRNP